MKFTEASGDGKYIASSFPYILDFDIRVWDANLKQVAIFKKHRGFVNQIAWNRDSKTIASCSEDYTLYIWTFTNIHTHILMKKKFYAFPPLSIAWAKSKNLFVLQPSTLNRLELSGANSVNGITTTQLTNPNYAADPSTVPQFHNIIYDKSCSLYAWSPLLLVKINAETMEHFGLRLPSSSDISCVVPVSEDKIIISDKFSVYLCSVHENVDILRTFTFRNEIFQITMHPSCMNILVNFIPFSLPINILFMDSGITWEISVDYFAVKFVVDFAWVNETCVAIDYGNSLNTIEFYCREWDSDQNIHYSEEKVKMLNFLCDLYLDPSSLISKITEDCWEIILREYMGPYIDFKTCHAVAFC